MAAISNRVVTIYNHKTSIRLAPAEWEAIDSICERERIPRKMLFELIAFNKDEKLGIASSIRLFMVIYYKNALQMDYQPSVSDDDFVNPVFEAIKGIV
jgi:predicted DNA-binding ribbon-helix-helix protein